MARRGTWIALESNMRKDRTQILTTAEGLITQNVERQAFTATQIMTDGTAYFMLVGLHSGDLVTNIHLAVTAVGVTLSLSKAGLYTKAGVQLAASADQATAWESTGVKTVAMATAYQVPSDDGYYVCLVSKGVTLPTLLRAANNSIATAAAGSGTAVLGTQTAQTNLPSPATITSGSGSPQGFWVGIS